MNDDPQNNGGMGGDQPQAPTPQPPMPGNDNGGDNGGMPAPGSDNPMPPAPQDPGMGGDQAGQGAEDAPHGDDARM